MSSGAIQSCMGGFMCSKRGHCAHYLAASPDQVPSERLCPPGQDGAGPVIPIARADTGLDWPDLEQEPAA